MDAIIGKRIEENKLLFCVRELLPHFSGRQIVEKLKHIDYSENQVKDAIEFLKKEKPDLSDLNTIYQGNLLLGKVNPKSEKMVVLKELVLRKRADEIYLEKYLSGNFVLGFEPDINLIPILVDCLSEKDPRIIGGAAFLIGKIGNIKSVDKLIVALEKIKLSETLEPQKDFEPSEYELAESIIGDSIVTICTNTKISKEGKIDFKRIRSKHYSGDEPRWGLENSMFDTKTKKEIINNLL